MKYLNLGCGNHFHQDWINIDSCSVGKHIISHDLRKPIPFPEETFDAVYHSHLLEHFSRTEAKPFLEECLRVLRPGGILRVVVPNLEQIAREYIRLLEEASNGSENAAHNYDWILLEMYDQAVRHYSGGDMAKHLSSNQLAGEDYVIGRIGYEGKTLINNLRGEALDGPQDVTTAEDEDELALKIGRFRLGGEAHLWMYDRYSLSRLLKASGFQDIRVCSASESQIQNFSDYRLDVLENGQVRKPDSLFMEAKKPNTIADLWRFDADSIPGKLKVVQILTNDIQGGAARAAYRLHQGLRLVNQDSLMLARYRKSEDLSVCSVSDLSPNDIPTEDYSLYGEIQANYINNNRTALSNTLFSYSYPAIDLTKINQIHQADILNLHWVAWFQSAETIASLLALGKPVVWTLHDMAAFTGGCHYSAGCLHYQHDCSQCPQLENDKYHLSASILEDKLRKLSGFPNLTIVTPSHWLADCVRRSQLFKDNRTEVIPYGLDINVFKPVPRALARKHLNISENEIVLLFGADSNIEKRKGADILVQALRDCLLSPLIQEAVQAKQIKILNFGEGYSGLESLGVPVLSLGYVNSDDELSYIYSASNALLLPSLEDNLPNLMLEAMSCGTPVIAFSTGGMVDLIEDGATGRLVPTGDVGSLADAILDLLIYPYEYERMGLSARSKIERNHSLEHQAYQYLALYQDLINNAQVSRDIICSRKLDSTESASLLKASNEAGRIALLEERQNFQHLHRDFTQTQLKIQEIQAALQQTQAALQQTQSALLQTQSDLLQTQSEFQTAQATIMAMKSSKFWKIREGWVRLKEMIG